MLADPAVGDAIDVDVLHGVGLPIAREREAEHVQLLVHFARDRHEGDDEVVLGDQKLDDVCCPRSFADVGSELLEVVRARPAGDVVVEVGGEILVDRGDVALVEYLTGVAADQFLVFLDARSGSFSSDRRAGPDWISEILQRLVVELLGANKVRVTLARAARVYATNRESRRPDRSPEEPEPSHTCDCAGALTTSPPSRRSRHSFVSCKFSGASLLKLEMEARGATDNGAVLFVAVGGLKPCVVAARQRRRGAGERGSRSRARSHRDRRSTHSRNA